MAYSFNDHNASSGKIPEKRNAFCSVETYTILSILRRMRETPGLEVMLEYLDIYLNDIEKNNPKIKMAVEQALRRFSVANIYKEAREWKKEREFLP